ncbi:hypothetical protein EMPS_09296 [Entomortierella parvispora]|uniref:PROP1-like PPR domain-containing protein n=1 Tax=Entomortierella parvispora TaxID=205924 RepID=A0A9P3HIJ1_9FUNG|nr:hypothetical protein EMPS_09296 [Entomortierella parvispora]
MHAATSKRIIQAGARSWDSQLAASMIRLFTARHRLGNHHPMACSVAPHQMPAQRRAIYHSAAGAMLDYDPSAVSQRSSSGKRSEEPTQPRLTIGSFLAPPGTEKHPNPYETIADSFKEKDDSNFRTLWDRDSPNAHDPVSPVQMMKEAVASGSARQVWHTYSRLRRMRKGEDCWFRSSKLYFTMLHCLQRSRIPESSQWATEIYGEMARHHSPKIQTLNTVLDILVRHSDNLQVAVDFFHREADRFNISPTVRSYNIIIRGLATGGQLEEAIKMYEDMRSGAIQARPDITTYSTIVGIYTRKNMHDQADAILKDMLNDNVKPNMWIFNTAISRLVKKKDFAGARRVMNLMESQERKPDVITYSTLIDGYAEDGNEEEIAKIQAEMALNHVYPNARTITSTIKVFAKSNLDSEIDARLEAIMKSLPTGEMNELTFGVLMNVYGKRKDLEAAMGIYDHISSKGRVVNDVIVNSLLDGHVRADKITMANKIFHDHFTVRQARPTSSLTYSIMITGCCKQGNLRDALHYYHQMNLFQIDPDSVVCSRLIQLYLQHHQLENAQNMLRLMRNTSLDVSVHTFTMMIDYLSNVQDNRGALRCYQQMVDDGVKPDVHCYTVLINAHMRAKNYMACDQTYERMIKAGIHPTLETFTSMVHVHSKQNNIYKLKDYWMAMMESGLLPDIKSFTLLLQSYGQQGNIEMVEFIYKEIIRSKIPMDAITLTTVASAYAALPNLNIARLDDIWATMEDLDLQPTPEYFKRLLDAYGERALPDRVIKLWQQSQTLARPLCWVPSQSNLLHLIEACRERGNMETLHSVWRAATVGMYWPPITVEPREHYGDDNALDEHHLGSDGTAGKSKKIRMLRPEPPVFTAYLNALLTHNRFSEIEQLLEEGCDQMKIRPRTKDFELLFTGLAQYGFLATELNKMRTIVLAKWPQVEALVDTIIRDTRKI